MAEYTGSVQVIRDGRIARLVLNRPQGLNAFGIEMAEELWHRLAGIAGDDEVAALVITGAGRAFCAGGDLNWVSQHQAGPARGFRELAARFHAFVLEIRHMPKPVIAAINGVAAGGGFSLALACDFRVMARDAVLRQAYTSSGLSIDGGGSFMLPRLVGYARAVEILAFDEAISADKAHDWGLVNFVVDRDAVLSSALGIAERLLGRSLSSFAASKRLLNESLHTSLEAQLEREREALAICADHPDGLDGVRAFIEKRKPHFART
jgi:2-(1,2-epoxy-1,2-dihydrophenyl)acetyl-CoA isomerase